MQPIACPRLHGAACLSELKGDSGDSRLKVDSLPFPIPAWLSTHRRKETKQTPSGQRSWRTCRRQQLADPSPFAWLRWPPESTPRVADPPRSRGCGGRTRLAVHSPGQRPSRGLCGLGWAGFHIELRLPQGRPVAAARPGNLPRSRLSRHASDQQNKSPQSVQFFNKHIQPSTSLQDRE